MKKLILLLTLFLLLVTISRTAAASQPTDNGFDQYGYNRTARIFNGTGLSWSLSKGLPAGYLGIYANDKLVMKWNAEWDRGNAEGWSDPHGYDAYLSNEWNGKIPGGSGETENFKCKWIGPCIEGKTLPDGGYCIWGQFEAIMDHYTGRDSLWLAHANPTGYGANK